MAGRLVGRGGYRGRGRGPRVGLGRSGPGRKLGGFPCGVGQGRTGARSRDRDCLSFHYHDGFAFSAAKVRRNKTWILRNEVLNFLCFSPFLIRN